MFIYSVSIRRARSTVIRRALSRNHKVAGLIRATYQMDTHTNIASINFMSQQDSGKGMRPNACGKTMFVLG